MIKIIRKISTVQRSTAFLTALVLMLSACSPDKDVKSAIRIKAKDNLNFAGLTYAVQNSVVTVKGRCATKESKSKAIAEIKDIHPVDSVIDQIEIKPFSIDSSLALKQEIDSIIVKYPSVMAEVTHGKVRLSGKTARKKLPELYASVQKVLNKGTYH